MRILGIAHDLALSSAALLEDGNIIAAVCEERLNRQKLYKGFPAKAIEYCLRQAKLKFEDVDLVAVGWNPGRHLAHPNWRHAVSSWKAYYLVTVPNLLQQFVSDPEICQVKQSFVTKGHALDIVYVDHHQAHLANAFYLSPFSEAALLSLDGVGEVDTGCMAFGDKTGIHVLKRLKFPHSLGLFYGTFTTFLGFKEDSDEWKVMALAAYGRNRTDNPYYPKVRDLVSTQEGGFFELDLSFFKHYLQDFVGFVNDKMISQFGPPRTAMSDFEPRHYDIAAAMQWVFEDIAAHCLTTVHRISGGCEAVAVGGGSFMNSVFNGRLEQVSPFSRSFVSSCPDDSGVSVGAALSAYAANDVGGVWWKGCGDNFWGPEFTESKDDIEALLAKYCVSYRKVADIEGEVAKILAAGKLVGWVQGRMEFGQRALGNRSILADPRHEETKTRVNAAVKYRESFRPFAPAVLEEVAHHYFDLPPGQNVPFMERVFQVRPEYQSRLAAVTHVDGSARVQTVSKRSNPRFYGLIERFGEITGLPVLLNTSFNLNGEPIVSSLTDALRTFWSCGLDYLVLDDCLLGKSDFASEEIGTA